ncbi:nucleotide exchange factor GrpE [Kitasatospora sp. NPDC096128]|uniref:nucleotide exchange factor GrpE n=1 Tax=Kitasatospora sp. NPDC096128 TaxID=3155547 RepID=UPI003327B010
MTDAPTASPLDGSPIDGSRPAGSPPAGRRQLEVPPGVEAVDLEAKFTQLLFRASLLGNKLTEQKQQARAEQRELLGVLVEVDDALAALGLDRELVALGRGAGLEATRRRLLGRLAKAGVRPMRLEGLAADPALTEIVGTEVRPGVAPETVVQTVVTGFFWEQEVLRRAQVVVAAPESAPVSTAEPAPVEDPRVAEPESAELKPEEPSADTTDAADAADATEPDGPPARPVPPRARRHAKAPGRPAKRAKRKK